MNENGGDRARGEETHMADPPPDVPRWVKVFGIVVIVLMLLVVAVMLVAGGEHGPGRHASSGDTRGQTPSSGFVAADHISLTGAYTWA